MEGLFHSLAWKPVWLPSEPQLPLSHVVFVAAKDNPLLGTCRKQLAKRRVRVTCLDSSEDLPQVSWEKNAQATILLYLPGEVEELKAIPTATREFTKELLDIVKYATTYLTGIPRLHHY